VINKFLASAEYALLIHFHYLLVDHASVHRLRTLWVSKSDLSEFIDFNDIGLPLAYLASEGLCDIVA
jgi:hypothetical protein